MTVLVELLALKREMRSMMQNRARKETWRQFSRYTLVGVTSNVIGYICYLLLTSWVLTPEQSVTVVYVIASVAGFYGNKRFTFVHEGDTLRVALRYFFAQFSGYLANLLILLVFVNRFGYDHKVVQGGAIIIVAAYLFGVSKAWVFYSEKWGEGKR